MGHMRHMGHLRHMELLGHMEHLGHIPPLWEILGHIPSVISKFYSAFELRKYYKITQIKNGC